ncbi:RICIN domain-containing protein [Dactylosporangium sp. CA-152071]|uniref:RICIN domain-containing protein n=1 Tax=Dactylosporangium sp. CA-152071 TaxID=3239933 RepID=UPI003D907D78
MAFAVLLGAAVLRLAAGLVLLRWGWEFAGPRLVWDCAGSPWTNQKWWARGDGSIVNLRSNLCLDTQNGATANGTRLWRPPAR